MSVAHDACSVNPFLASWLYVFTELQGKLELRRKNRKSMQFHVGGAVRIGGEGRGAKIRLRGARTASLHCQLR